MIQKPPTTSDKPTDTTAIYGNILKSNFNYKISEKALKEAIDKFIVNRGKKKV
jgi:hypothetical protein